MYCLTLIDTSAADISLYYFDFIDIFSRNIQEIIAQHSEIRMISGRSIPTSGKNLRPGAEPVV